ncbi:uncharacterized protein K489DRAFT_384188 [Dissoconium aciculare CBS 342.82]|uniref:Extracellular membrane protein CFEM domain-containing protein n=1 Tax=Dissoconium aciculare CBS 342.82 TaxID=1314786 RepID=A0A6J3LVF2_9PEZI|nr:uncharacterized protein K489DRAFT_384188 [Dissoconium aciculare CBS 342.82]KAF1819269.1 hypothetical protein K489DRAFT_384188 [Dissoconium aciculare CBS 342.82]
MLSSQFTLASLLAASSLVAASAPEALHQLVSRQSSSGSANTCTSGLTSGCFSSSSTESGCRSAICSASCLDFVPGLSTCCNANSDIQTFSDCALDIIGDGSITSPGASTATTTSSSRSIRTSTAAATTSATSSRAGFTSTYNQSDSTTAPGTTILGGAGTTTASTAGPTNSANTSPAGTVIVSVQTNAQGQPTNTVTKTGGVERIVPGAGQLGVAGSMFAWALSLLLL